MPQTLPKSITKLAQLILALESASKLWKHTFKDWLMKVISITNILISKKKRSDFSAINSYATI